MEEKSVGRRKATLSPSRKTLWLRVTEGKKNFTLIKEKRRGRRQRERKKLSV